MDYTELTVTGFEGFDPEIILAMLAETGFESFEEEGTALRAYIRKDLFDEARVAACLREIRELSGLACTTREIPDQNWNALWESSYEPVTVAGKCRVRAPFHAPGNLQFEIIVEPRMSFGTAHHETTSLMIEMLMDEDVTGRRVLDMGCGTGVLAILASMMGAAEVVAIDNDEWAFSNAADNLMINRAGNVQLIRGDAGSIPGPACNIILANINRNVLLEDINVYAEFLGTGGILLVSGFFLQDLPLIREAAAKAGLHYALHKSNNQWTAARFVK